MIDTDSLVTIVCGSLITIISILFIIYNANKYKEDVRLKRTENYLRRGFWIGLWFENIVYTIIMVINNIANSR